MHEIQSFAAGGTLRFCDCGMIKTFHASGQRVVLHVALLIMGKNSKALKQMKP